MSEGAERRAAQGMFRSLRVRNYRLFASANLLSTTGTWLQRIGQDWLVLQLSGNSGVALGAMTALQFGPTLVFSMYGGVLADRYSKRRILLITQGLMGVLALLLGLLVLTDRVVLWHVFVLAGGLGVVSAIDIPVRQAFISEMVGPELLPNAVSLNSTIFNMARLVGPALAGALIGAASGDTAPAFLINAASFGFTVGALLAVRAGELRLSPLVARGPGQLRAGLEYTRARPDLVLAIVLAAIVGMFGTSFSVNIALMAREEYGLGAQAFGLLSTFVAVGSLAGSLVSARRNARPRLRFLVVAAMVYGIVMIVAGLMPGYAWFAAMLVPAGAATMVFTVANNSFVQLGAEPHMRGRVMALYFMFYLGGTPVGSPAIGWVAERFGAPVAIVVAGCGILLAGAGGALWLARGHRVRLASQATRPWVRLEVTSR